MYIAEEQTTQGQQKKSSKGQTPIYRTYPTTKDRVTRVPLSTVIVIVLGLVKSSTDQQ